MVEVKQDNKTTVNVPPEMPKEGEPKISDSVKGIVNKGVSFVVNGPPKKVGPEPEPEKPAPTATKQPTYEGQQTEKLYDIKNLASNLTPKKIAAIFGIIVMVVLIGAALYVKFIRATPVRQVNVLVTPPTPTYSPYQKYKPSVYAEDPNFKKIDEGMNVLYNEVEHTSLDDQTLTPPSLDFKIDFK